MRVLLDQGLPRSAVEFLCQAGVETVHVGNIGLASADDLAILDYAEQHGQVVVTLDTDFHAILAISGAVKPSVIRIREEGLQAEDLADLLMRIIRTCEQELDSGALISANTQRIRLRRLPLIGH